jgi:DNA-binding response OmpR family regulator
VNILILESNRQLARALKRALEDERFAVTQAADLPHAERCAQSSCHDVILLDLPPQIELPVLRHWRQSGINQPVLFLSQPGSRSQAFESLGPVAFLTKPFHLDDLLCEVGRLVDAHAACAAT